MVPQGSGMEVSASGLTFHQAPPAGSLRCSRCAPVSVSAAGRRSAGTFSGGTPRTPGERSSLTPAR